MAGLALMALLYPREGVTFFNVQAEFPSMEEVLGAETEESITETETEEEKDTLPEMTPEQLMDMRMAELEAARDSEFMVFCRKSPTRLHMPDDDITYLDPVFEALEHASERPVRIMHYGDSQLEGDRMTGALREKMLTKQTLGHIPALRQHSGFLQSCVRPVDRNADIFHTVAVGRIVLHNLSGANAVLNVDLSGAELITIQEGEYEFVMPDHDVSIRVWISAPDWGDGA